MSVPTLALIDRIPLNPFDFAVFGAVPIQSGSKPCRRRSVASDSRVKYWTWVGRTDHQRAPMRRASALPVTRNGTSGISKPGSSIATGPCRKSAGEAGSGSATASA